MTYKEIMQQILEYNKTIDSNIINSQYRNEFKSSCKFLETLPYYNESSALYKQYHEDCENGRAKPEDYINPWKKQLKTWQDENKFYEKVMIVSPIKNKYQNHSLKWFLPTIVEYGARAYTVSLDQVEVEKLTFLTDIVIFDDQKVVFPIHDTIGSYGGVLIVPEELCYIFIDQYNFIKNLGKEVLCIK
jgi:hypothetical protein